MAKTFYILDGHYQIYRAFYGLPQRLSSPTGEPTGATHVFCQMLFNLLRDRKPDYFAMAMDVSDKTVFRCEIDENYKANREPAPEELYLQADRIVSIVTELGIPILRVPGFEADDVMATLAERFKDQPIDIYLVSRDKDLEQLITSRVRLFDSKDSVVLDQESLLEKKDYTPGQAVDVQTLAGDSTDNIPGVQGVGVKTAAKLIKQYGSAEAVLEHANELTPKMCERVKAFAGQLPITRTLVTLRRDVPFEFDLDKASIDRIDVAAVRPIFLELGLNRLIEQSDTLSTKRGTGTKDESTGGAIDEPVAPAVSMQGRYELIDTPDKLETLTAKLAAQSVFAFDTETTGLNPVRADLVGISFSWQSGEAYYVPVRAVMGSTVPLEAVLEKLKPIFEDASIAKVGHHIKYDTLVMRQVGIHVAGIAFDTLLASFLLDPLRGSHALDNVVVALIGHEMIPISDLIGKGRNQITIDHIDTRQVCEYASEDADFTWRLYELFKPQIDASHVASLFHDTEIPLVGVLAEMEHNGIALDCDLLEELGESLADRTIELTKDIHRATGHEFNIDSPKQLGVVLFDEQGLSVVRKTKTGRSTDADTLQTLVEQTGHPIPRLVLEYRELSKLKSTYVDTLPKMICPRTGRVHASFHQTGAITGRLSSSDPNLQNIPIRTEQGRRIREAIVAGDPDSVLLTADYSQIELRLLAHFCQDEALVAAFESGKDIHRAVAAQVNGVPPDEVTSKQRSSAKAVNFGIIYGQTPFGLARSLGIPVGDARTFIDMYFMRYPGIRMFIDECVASARKNGYAETILGRRRPIQELRSHNRQQIAFGERIAVNTVVQGSAADLIKRAMIDIHRELMSGGHSARMLIQVHDELVFEVPRQDVETEAGMVREKMERAIELRVPLTVDIAWGRTWAEGK